MTLGLVALLILAGVIVIVGLWAMGTYNGLVTLNQNVDTAWSNIDVALKQRHDEIPKLVAVCEGYKNFERSTLEAVIKARSQYTTANTPDEKMAASGQLSGALRGLMAVAESYPDLKSSQNFIQLQQRISNLEATIAGHREGYNSTVNNLNIGIRQFPGVFFARMLNLQSRKLFEVSEADKEDVKIQFS